MLELATIQYIFFSLTLNIGVHILKFISRREHMWRNHIKDEFKRPLQLLCIDLSSSLVPNFHICNVFVTYLKLTYPALLCKLLFCNFYDSTGFFSWEIISMYKIDKKSSSNFDSSSGKEKSYPPRIVRVRIAFDSLKKNMNRQQILEADPI